MLFHVPSATGTAPDSKTPVTFIKPKKGCQSITSMYILTPVTLTAIVDKPELTSARTLRPATGIGFYSAVCECIVASEYTYYCLLQSDWDP